MHRPIGTSGLRAKGMQRSTFGGKGHKVKGHGHDAEDRFEGLAVASFSTPSAD